MISKPQASYLIRFDDICPTMRWSTWDLIEQILMEYEIKPIVAVIPDNGDPELQLEPAEPAFWDRVRGWKAAGWTIGMHGFQHTYVTSEPGLYGNQRASEFAGLPRQTQREKLERALTIFLKEGIQPDLWIAPGHSFDQVTVSLLAELGVMSISDGYSIWPYTDELGIFWIPQQLSENQILPAFGRGPVPPKPIGVWTVCVHPNAWTARDIGRFEEAVRYYRPLFRATAEIRTKYLGRKKRLIDWFYAASLHTGRRLRLSLNGEISLRAASH